MLLAPPTTSQRKAAGLEAGADDFLARPFGSAELLARVRAILRRGTPESGTRLRYEGLELDLAAHRASRAGQTVSLAPKEFALLEYLLRNPDRVLTRQDLAAHVWGSRRRFDSNTIEVYISMLRRKLDRDPARRLIRTVTGYGYMLSRDEEPRDPLQRRRAKSGAM
jgi:DNA-binding response OmpR family regulator